MHDDANLLASLPQYLSVADKTDYLSMTVLPLTADPQKVAFLQSYKSKKMQQMQRLYPFLLQRTFKGKIAYTLQSIAPEAVIEAGGFKAKDNITPWVSTTGSGDNKGCICFSLLPEISTLFIVNTPPQQKAYLYAFPLIGEFFLPGGKWRQIISPGAFPLTKWWLAREIVDLQQGQVKLGPLLGHNANITLTIGEHFQNFCANTITQPKEKAGDQHSPLEFTIIDTPYTQHFQKEVQAHYQNHQPALVAKQLTKC